MSKIIIQLQGGLVQDVFKVGKGPVTGYITVDEDEDADPQDQTTVKTGKGKDYSAVCGGIHSINKLPKGSDVDRIVKAYLK